MNNVMDRRSFVTAFFLGCSIGKGIDHTVQNVLQVDSPELYPAELGDFVRMLKKYGPNSIRYNFVGVEEQQFTPGPYNIYIRNNGEHLGPGYHTILHFRGPDGVNFERTAKNDSVGFWHTATKKEQSLIISTVRNALAKMQDDIYRYYVPEKRDESFTESIIGAGLPLYPATFINGKTVV